MSEKQEIITNDSRKEAKSNEKRGMAIALILALIIIVTLSFKFVLPTIFENRRYEKFVTENVFIDNNGVNILGTYVPVGEGIRHEILQDPIEGVEKEYVLFVIVEAQNLRQAVMRINKEEAENITRHFGAATNLQIQKAEPETKQPTIGK